MSNPSTEWTEDLFFGYVKGTLKRRVLSAPSWDCDWYWGFGYLGNKTCHYHLSSYASSEEVLELKGGGYKVLTEDRNISMYDALKKDYDLNPVIENNLWTFCELSQTAYALRQTAEVLGRGGSHYSKNPVQDLILNKEEEHRINHGVLPGIFDCMNELFVRRV